MTDKQLYILLDTLRQELASTIEEIEELLSVHGVERSQKIVARNKDGQEMYGGLAAIGATLRGEVRYEQEDDPFGRFVALAPLDTLVKDWELRFVNLLPGETEERGNAQPF